MASVRHISSLAEKMGWSCSSIQQASWNFTKAFGQSVIILQDKESRHSSKETTYWSFLFDSFLSFRGRKKKEEPPVCVACNIIITVQHILIECADLVAVRKNILRRDLCIHCSEMWNWRKFLTTLKRLVCSKKYELCWSVFCGDKYFELWYRKIVILEKHVWFCVCVRLK